MKALAFVVAIAVCAALFLLLPREMSRLAFSSMIAVSLLATGYHQRRQLRTALKTLVEWLRGDYQTTRLLLKRSRAAIASYRHRWSRPAVCAACALLVFLLARSVSEKREHAPSRPASPAKTPMIRHHRARSAPTRSPFSFTRRDS